MADMPEFVPEPREPKQNQQPNPVEQLRAQLAAEQRARMEAEQRANDLAQNAHEAKVNVANSQMDMVNSAIQRTKDARNSLKAAKRQAMASGDWDAVAELDEQMADEAARLLQLENGKAAMEAEPKPEPPQPVHHVSSDPVEAFTSRMSQTSAAWVRAHPEYVLDEVKRHGMIGAHNAVIARGIKPDSPEYFKKIEEILGIEDDGGAAETTVEDPTEYAAKPVERTPPPAPPAAPVSRSSGNSSSRAKLTLAEQEAAEFSGVTYEEYARNRELLKKEGRYH